MTTLRHNNQEPVLFTSKTGASCDDLRWKITFRQPCRTMGTGHHPYGSLLSSFWSCDSVEGLLSLLLLRQVLLGCARSLVIVIFMRSNLSHGKDLYSLGSIKRHTEDFLISLDTPHRLAVLCFQFKFLKNWASKLNMDKPTQYMCLFSARTIIFEWGEFSQNKWNRGDIQTVTEVWSARFTWLNAHTLLQVEISHNPPQT